jgi:hypothetical protein
VTRVIPEYVVKTTGDRFFIPAYPDPPTEGALEPVMNQHRLIIDRGGVSRTRPPTCLGCLTPQERHILMDGKQPLGIYTCPIILCKNLFGCNSVCRAGAPLGAAEAPLPFDPDAELGRAWPRHGSRIR